MAQNITGNGSGSATEEHLFSLLRYILIMELQKRIVIETYNPPCRSTGEIHFKETNAMEELTVKLANPLLADRLHTLAVEYSTSNDLLVNVAVKRLLDDVALLRNLRAGKVKLE